MVPVEIKQSYREGDIVGNRLTQPQAVHHVLWLDPTGPLSETSRIKLQLAGMHLLNASSLTELKLMLVRARMVVIRLVDDISLMTEVQELLRGLPRQLPLVCRVDANRLDLGMRAVRQGASDVLAADEWSEEVWTRTLEALASNNTVIAHKAAAASAQSAQSGAADAEERSFVFVDPVSQKLLALAQRVAQAGVTTLLTGPTGAGKEVMARILHEASQRRDGPFVGLNCAAMPESMIEDLLFGHEKGAFTGAQREHAGVFVQAVGGTLFLDEIGEMPIGLQAKLLRVIQEKQVTRIGAQSPIPVDFRLVAATNKDLRAAIAAREFREDLYFRISAFRLRIPALAERSGDVLPLARQMLQAHAANDVVPAMTEQAEELLTGYSWPGNVRELANVMQRALVLSGGSTIDAEHLIFEDLSEPCSAVNVRSMDGLDRSATSLGDTQVYQPAAYGGRAAEEIAAAAIEAASAAGGISGGRDAMPAAQDEALPDLGSAIRNSEQRAIAAALRATSNRVEAAKALGISPRTLRYKLAQLRDHGLSVVGA